MTRHSWRVAATAFLSCGIAIAPVRADVVVQLGAVGVQSGPSAQWGIAVRQAVEFAAAEANRDKSVRIDGQPVTFKVISVDSKYTAEGGAAAANTLASQGVKLVVGPVGSPEVTGFKPLSVRNGMLVMGNSYAKNAIGPQWPLVFHVTPGPSAWADPLIRIARTKWKFDSVFVIAPNDQGGSDVATVNAEAFRANGVKASEEYYQRGTTNFAPVVTRIMNANPGAVDLASSPPTDAGTIIKQLRQAGFTGPIARLGGPGYGEIRRVAGGDEVLRDFFWFEPVVLDEGTGRLEAKYKEVMGKARPDNEVFFQFVVAARLLLKAVGKAGTATDSGAVAAALRGAPVSDPELGEGSWVGKDFFGLDQEISLPFGMGMVIAGALQPILRVDAVKH